MEMWLPVIGFEDHYEVSSLGRVRSKDRLIRMVVSGTSCERVHLGRIRKPTFDQRGYPHVSLKRQGVHIRRAVHILVCEAFIGPRPEGHQAAHNDGNPANSALKNLRWATPAENNADKHRHGTILTRSNGHPRAKLSDSDVQAIFEERDSGTRVRDLAGRFDVSKGLIYRILRNRKRPQSPRLDSLADSRSIP